MNDKIHVGYILTNHNEILLQLPGDNRHGFVICDDDQTWPGGEFRSTMDFIPIADDDARITKEDRERLQWILDEARTTS